MTDREAIDRVLRTRGACPICEEKGATYLAPLHALRGHLSKYHTVDQLVYQIAGEAVLSALEDEQERKEEVEDPPKLATGGFIEGPNERIKIDLSREQIITAEQARNSPTIQAALEKFRQRVEEVQESESQDGDSPNA